MKNETSTGRAGIIGAVKTPLGFFTLICLVVEATLGALALRLSGDSQLVALYGMIGTLVLLILVVALIAVFWPRSLGATSDQPPALETESYCGWWWELIPNDPDIAVCFFQIASCGGSKLQLEGASYNKTGAKIATWRSEWACFNDASRELFYFWVGDERSDKNKDHSGVGYLYFNQQSDGRRFERGTGWFTFGDLRELRLEGKRKIDLRRVSDLERKQITDEKSEAAVALSVYEEWAKTLPKQSDRGVKHPDNAV